MRRERCNWRAELLASDGNHIQGVEHHLLPFDFEQWIHARTHGRTALGQRDFFTSGITTRLRYPS